MDSNSKRVVTRSTSQSGASLVEYVLLIMLISIIAIAAVRAFGNQLSSSYSSIASAVEDSRNP